MTARRRAEALQDVPIAVQAFSGAQLEERNIQDATDLQRLVPALTTYQQARDEITLSLQGQASSGASAQGQNPRVTAYFAEVPLQTSDTGPGRFFDLQNVQVLKGPQGTLFGRNSTGGAVLYEPRRPTRDFEGYISGPIGRFDERQVEAAVNTPVSEGLALRFAGKRSKRDGFTKNLTTGQRQDDRDYSAGRISALLTPSDDIQSFFMFDYLKSDTNGSSQQYGGFGPNKALTADVFENTPLGAAGAAAAALSRALHLARIAIAAEQAGGAEAVLDMSVTYSKDRVQFGRPIGSFQALKHRMADIMVLVETAKTAVFYAAATADEGRDDLEEPAANAKQMSFRNELDHIIEAANANGAARDPLIRQRIADAHIGLTLMRYNALRTLSNQDAASLAREAFIHKIYWATWHRKLGELAMDVLGPAGLSGAGDLVQLYLQSRSDWIHGGTNEIQRNIIAERALGLPREPRGTPGR